MTRDELRRLAIRLARRKDRDGDTYCGECFNDPIDDAKHDKDCPIAELEAEETRSKLRPIEPKRNPENCEPGYIRTTKTSDGFQALMRRRVDEMCEAISGMDGNVGNYIESVSSDGVWTVSMSVHREEKPAGKFEGEY